MPLSPPQIKEKLLKGIDEDTNIVDPKIVVEVIELLEKIAITRTDLEITRLGWYINSIRKQKNTNSDIAKRCKKLLKSWQQQFNTAPSNQASPAGYSPALSRLNNHSNTASPKLPSHSLSPALPPNVKSRGPSPLQPGKVVSPASVALNHGRVPAGRVASPAGRLVSPLVRQSGNVKAQHLAGRKPSSPAITTEYSRKGISPSNSRLATPTTSTYFTPRNTTPSSQAQSKPLITVTSSSSRPQTPTSNNHINSTPNLDSTNRTHAANKKRRRSDESVASDASSIKKLKETINGDTRLNERTKTPKVKTTVQLIAELGAQKSSSFTASDTITQIVTNQIKKEEDDINMSVVPASAKPRPRRKNGSLINPPEAPSDMTLTKSDLVHRFLQQQHAKSVSSAEDTDVDIVGLDPVGSNGEPTKPNKPVIDMSINPYSLLPPLDLDSITWSDDEDDKGPVKRNPITGEYPDGYEHSAGDNAIVLGPNSLRVNKMLTREWNGVTGTSSNSNIDQFHEWTDTFIISNNASDRNESNDVYVLPYVDI